MGRTRIRNTLELALGKKTSGTGSIITSFYEPSLYA